MSGAFDFIDQGQNKRAARKGCSFTRDFVWKDSSVVPAEAIDLTGYTALFTVSAFKGAPVLLTATVANSKLVIVEAEGKITLSLLDTDTNALNYGRYYYSLVVDGGATSTVRLLEGIFEVV